MGLKWGIMLLISALIISSISFIFSVVWHAACGSTPQGKCNLIQKGRSIPRDQRHLQTICFEMPGIFPLKNFKFGTKMFRGYQNFLIYFNILGPHYIVSFSPGWNFAPPTGLKYCWDYMLNFRPGQNANVREKVYWSAKTQSTRMLVFLFRPGLKFRFDYMRLFQIFRPVWPGWKS